MHRDVALGAGDRTFSGLAAADGGGREAVDHRAGVLEATEIGGGDGRRADVAGVEADRIHLLATLATVDDGRRAGGRDDHGRSQAGGAGGELLVHGRLLVGLTVVGLRTTLYYTLHGKNP